MIGFEIDVAKLANAEKTKPRRLKLKRIFIITLVSKLISGF
jgi:hypothetical protein